MTRRAAQQRKRTARARKSMSFIREDEPGYALPGMGQPPSVTSISQVTKLNGGFKDSAFGDNKSKPIHRWIPWIAGFSSEFVRDVFSQYLPTNQHAAITVLDPFCGVGTTLVEAQLNGYDAVGFEINPYAALAARAKLELASTSPTQFQKFIQKFDEYMRRNGDELPLTTSPTHFNTRIPFFGKRTEQKVSRVMQFIRAIRASTIADLFSLAFGSVMVSLSNYSYEPSLSSRPAVGKALQEDAPVLEAMLTKLLAMKSDILRCHSELEKFNRVPTGRVIADSFMNALNHIQRESVDLVVTSPPYLNNYHYVRNTRPQLFWLGFVKKPKDLKRLETENFGKYWQTVRDAEAVPLDFEHAEVQRLVDRIRSINVERKGYGGPGWANYAVSYFNDTNRFCEILSAVVKVGAHAVIVVGNSILQGIEIPIDNIVADLASRHGFKTVAIHVVREKRVGASIVGSSVRQGARTTAKLYESAVVLRRR
jgi:SAM-dependent methyltransferase